MRRIMTGLVPAVLLMSAFGTAGAQTRTAPSIGDAVRRVPPRVEPRPGVTGRVVQVPAYRCDDRYDGRYRNEYPNGRDPRLGARGTLGNGTGTIDTRRSGNGTGSISKTGVTGNGRVNPNANARNGHGCGYDRRDDHRYDGRYDGRYDNDRFDNGRYDHDRWDDRYDNHRNDDRRDGRWDGKDSKGSKNDRGRDGNWDRRDHR